MRNPWARMLSWWRMMERFRDGADKGIDRYLDHLQRNRFVASVIEKHPDFESFVMHAPDEHPRLRKPQVEFLNTPTKQADFVGRQESLEADLERIYGHLGLDWEQPTERQHRPGPARLPRRLHRDDQAPDRGAVRAGPARLRLRVLEKPS